MIRYQSSAFSLEIEGSRVGIVIDGTTVARLDMRSAVHQLNENGERVRDIEQQEPVVISSVETADGIQLVWRGKSSLWEEKRYTLNADPLRFTYSFTVRGKGRVDGIEYFSGNASDPGSGSEYEFQYGFFPCQSWYNSEDYYFRASTKCHRWSVLMVPPMFCYAFRTPGLSRQLALGLAAKPGEHNFNSFDYVPTVSGWKSRFHLETDQFGHTAADGEWEAPQIVGYAAEDEFDAMRKYSDYYYLYSGMDVPKKKIPPKFWHGPMACGWIQQFAENGLPWKGSDGAREEVYLDYLSRLKEAGLYPRCLIIDDKWQSEYGVDIANPEKWPDLRRFVDERRAEGIHTMLWFKIFDPEGIPEEAVVTTEEGDRRVDPSHPAFIKILDEALTRIFSSGEGCYDCDGIKIDYAFQIPIGRAFRTYSGKYGVELLYDFMKHIYDKAKEIKPEAIINCSPCHPYFASVCDQARLHDYNPDNRYCREDMTMRAKMYSIAMPGVLLDTDNAGFNTSRDTMRWLLDQPSVGVPDLYCVSPIPGAFAFREAELKALAKVWEEYTKRIDLEYGE
ncbi:MAG: hypothetical protein E7576_14135 [Ruminococcaceae bacterium]|jgi:hypothetical protein|nr:hypothetical protein [Oscillospiraceae bacterium]